MLFVMVISSWQIYTIVTAALLHHVLKTSAVDTQRVSIWTPITLIFKNLSLYLFILLLYFSSMQEK